MAQLADLSDRTKLFTVFVLLFSVLYFFFYVDRAQVLLDIKVSEPTDFCVYWAGEDGLYSETRMASVRVRPGKTEYSFFLTDLAAVKKLRIDPQKYTGWSLIRQLSFVQNGFVPLVIADREDFSKLKPLHQIKSSVIHDHGLELVSESFDPFYELHYQPKNGPFSWKPIVLQLLAALLVIYLLTTGLVPLVKGFSYVPLLFAVIFGLVLVMAVISQNDVHPDEYVHLAAANYYQDHWLPPVVGDPAIRDTYSVYGSSRLNSHEVYYFFGGKFQKIISPLQLSDHLSLRLFNVSLFGLLLLVAMGGASGRVQLLSLLVSAQLWYVFSYGNSDAFSLFLTMIAGVQICVKESAFNRLIRGEAGWARFVLPLVLGLLFGLLFLLKKNYFPFVAFLFIVLFWDIVTLGEREAKIRALKWVALVVLIGVGLAGLRIGTGYMVNGMDRSDKIIALEEKMATPAYKRSTPLEEKHPSLSQRARGTTIKQMLLEYHWLNKTYVSGFGNYGYFIARGSYVYYQILKVVLAAFLVFVVCSILARGGWGGLLLVSSGLGLGAALTGASFYHSWTADFQAQGRYLFSFAPMLGLLCIRYERLLQPHLLCTFIVTLFGLGFYSFVWVGLMNIDKLG